MPTSISLISYCPLSLNNPQIFGTAGESLFYKLKTSGQTLTLLAILSISKTAANISVSGLG